jgi:integrase
VATLYRPKVTTYRLPGGAYRTPDGKRVTKDTPGAVREESRSKTWWGRYTDAAGKKHQVKLSTSKEIARRMLAKLAGDAQLASAGIADPFAEHRGRPILEHLEDYGRFVAGKDNTAKYNEQTVSMIRRAIEGCGFKTAEDLQPGAVLEFLAGLREDGTAVRLDGREWYEIPEAAALLGVRPHSLRSRLRRGPFVGPPPERGPGRRVRVHRDTLAGLLERNRRGLGASAANDYLGAVKRFSRWLARDRRTPFDPLAHLTRFNPALDVRHPRRPLTAEEFGRFVEATGGGAPFGPLAGADRLVIYCLSARTGLRAGELASLTPASFDFAARPPTVTVEAAYSKHRRKDVLPLRPDVAELARAYCEGRPQGVRLWPGMWWRQGAEMVRRDLADAGIPYEDGRGRLFDFHALRHSFLTHLAESRVHPKVAQVLARHSSIRLTLDVYTHLEAVDVAGDLDKLPDLPLAAGVGGKRAAGGENPAAGCKAHARRQRA